MQININNIQCCFIFDYTYSIQYRPMFMSRPSKAVSGRPNVIYSYKR